MSLEGLINGFSDTYERKARLYPALLALVPFFGVSIGVYGAKLEAKETLIALIVSIGGFYLLANIARELGKRREEELFENWGGKPSTQLQRHRDKKIEIVTKLKRHVFLANRLDVHFPTSLEEQSDQKAADGIYAAGTRWLIEKTRDVKKFPMLFSENISYGYRRNALGLKPISLSICFFAIIWTLKSEKVISYSGFNQQAFLTMPVGASLSLLLSALLTIVWIFFFTKRTVRTAAFAYAEALLNACSIFW